MLRGLYTAAQGMKVQQKLHDTAINNMANVNTPGFKSDNAMSRTFPEELLYFMGKQEGAHLPDRASSAAKFGMRPYSIGTLAQGVTIEEMVTRFTQGAIRETGRNLDMAIIDGTQEQKNFFVVKKELDSDEVFYTRSGNFRLREVNGEQYLTTQDGEFVMQRQGGDAAGLQPIVLNSEDNITVYPDGRFEIEDPGFAAIEGELHVVQFAAEQLPGLMKEGHGLYAANQQFLGAGFVPGVAANVQVQQAWIEGSNVDPTQVVVDMMTAQRAYESNQRVIQAYDRALDKIANEIGRV